MDRVFLDANILFSASYRSDAGLLRLWSLPGTTLVVSSYALEEARRNCTDGAHRDRLEALADSLELVPNPPLDPDLDELDGIPASDRPILQAAVSSRCGFLITGDRRAFGPFFGEEIRGVLILKAAAYLKRHAPGEGSYPRP